LKVMSQSLRLRRMLLLSFKLTKPLERNAVTCLMDFLTRVLRNSWTGLVDNSESLLTGYPSLVVKKLLPRTGRSLRRVVLMK